MKIIYSLILIITIACLGFGGYYLYQHQDSILPKADQVKYTPVTKEVTDLVLEVNSPEENSLVFEKNLLVSGKTSSSAFIVITTLNDSLGLVADDKGGFSGLIPLQKGINALKVSSFAPNGESIEVIRNVYFSEEKIE